MKNDISSRIPHTIPADLKKALATNKVASEKWEQVTPLGRNEFMCWVLSAKQEKTRERRVRRTIEELLEGKKRPCCWIGCIHRADKKMSASQKFILRKKK